MKTSPILKGVLVKLVIAGACLAPCTKAATIIDPMVYIGIADGGLVATVPAAEYHNYQHGGDWSSMAGGQMTISIAPGQLVTSATMSAAWAHSPAELESAAYTKVWTFSFAGSFPAVGLDDGDQLWKETGFAGSQPYWWQVTQPSGELAYVKFKFEAVTSEGIVVDDNGGAGYRGIAPEPSSLALVGIGLPLLFGRRRSAKLCN